jgi:hypothetical protein
MGLLGLVGAPAQTAGRIFEEAASLVRRRLDGVYDVDEWGLDEDAAAAAVWFATRRWDLDVSGGANLPPDGPVLVVVNRRFGVSEPGVVALAGAKACGRRLRVAGVADVAPIGPALRAIGGVLARPDEVRGLLRAGEAVAVLAAPMPRQSMRAGELSPALLAPAVSLSVPIVPLAIVGRELGRRWSARFGPPVPGPGVGRRRSGPLAAAEMADTARAALQEQLDDSSPPRWLLAP